MSFGFSASDFISFLALTKDIICALRSTAGFEYRELEVELHSLNRALDEIEHLRTTPENEALINAIKATALTCRYPLDEFRAKLDKYGPLSLQGSVDQENSSEKNGMVNVLARNSRRWGRAVSWEVSMKEEAARLRTYLNMHVNIINTRLLTLGVTLSTLNAQNMAEQGKNLETQLMQSHNALVAQGDEVKSQIRGIFSYISLDVISQLSSIRELAWKVWQSNILMISLLTRIGNLQNTVPIDTAHTWFQTPLRFEDALGRVLPIPSEYDWGKLVAVINEQFKSGPGWRKTGFGEYEILNGNDMTQVINASNYHLVRPGMRLTMAMIIVRFDHSNSRYCPRPDCRSSDILLKRKGIKECQTCSLSFGTSQTILPRPYQMRSLDNVINRTAQKGALIEYHRTNPFHIVREERKFFHNVQVLDADVVDLGAVHKRYHASRLSADSPDQTHHPRRKSKTNPTRAHFECTIQDPLAEKILSLTSEELGIDRIELSEDDDFAYFGLDSLLPFCILDRVEKQHGIKLPLDFFLSHPTPGAVLRADFCEFKPISISTRDNLEGRFRQDLTEKILDIVTEEMGVERSEISDDDKFEDAGVDSLLLLCILDRVEKDLDIKLPLDFFFRHTTPRELLKADLRERTSM